MRRTLLFLIGLYALAAPLWAQEVSMSAQVAPQHAGVGETMRLEITISGQANISDSPALPDLSDFQVYSGGRSSNFTFINGQVSSSLQFTYMLVPKHSGKFTIGPVTISHGGKTYSTQPLTVEVGGGAGAGGPSVAAPGQPSQSAPQSAARHAGDAVFITTQVDRREVYVNQPITLTFRFYSRIPILSQPQYQPPDTSGFWAEDLPPQREYITQVNGQEFKVIEIKTTLFPTTAGKLTISPANLVVQIGDFNRETGDPFADSFFRNFFSGGRQVNLRSEPIAVTVKPVPQANRPADFSGTVGRWSLSAKLDRKEARVGEAVTLEVRVFGEGNIKSVGKPSLPTFTGFKVYDTISSSEVQKQGAQVRGVKTYRTLLRPEVTGNLTLPPIRYAYFDPYSGKFERMEIPGLALKVLPGDANTAPAPAGPVTSDTSGPEVKMMSKDIRYLKTQVPLTPPAKPLPPIFWLLAFGLPPLALALLWARQWQQRQLAANPEYARRLASARMAALALRQARSARHKRDVAGFYGALSQALTGYLADQLGLSRSGVTQREILQRLAESGVNEAAQTKLSRLWEECDFARFAPSQQEAKSLEQHEREAELLLTELGRMLGKEKKA